MQIPALGGGFPTPSPHSSAERTNGLEQGILPEWKVAGSRSPPLAGCSCPRLKPLTPAAATGACFSPQARQHRVFAGEHGNLGHSGVQMPETSPQREGGEPLSAGLGGRLGWAAPPAPGPRRPPPPRAGGGAPNWSYWRLVGNQARLSEAGRLLEMLLRSPSPFWA